LAETFLYSLIRLKALEIFYRYVGATTLRITTLSIMVKYATFSRNKSQHK
jgi:hypothetical protein